MSATDVEKNALVDALIERIPGHEVMPHYQGSGLRGFTREEPFSYTVRIDGIEWCLLNGWLSREGKDGSWQHMFWDRQLEARLRAAFRQAVAQQDAPKRAEREEALRAREDSGAIRAATASLRQGSGAG